jgi:SAM-dependent methyltransferase
MGKVGRYLKYGIAAPIIDSAIALFPPLSASEAPPSAINFAGGGDFLVIGDAIVGSLIELADLKDGETVVDIGCGIGRNGTALSRHFGDRINYLGFDIVRYGITWCRKHFAQNGRYSFFHADIYNSFYNPRGRINPAEYAFPCRTDSADVVFATSVFTHMQASEVRHYINETARIVKPGGRCYFTFFLIDEDSEQSIKAGTSSFTFSHQGEGCRIESTDEPDMAVAYGLPWVEETLVSAGFRVCHIVRASWRGIASPYYQDIVVAMKSS